MFTGIITHVGVVTGTTSRNAASHRIRISCKSDARPAHVGDSIAVAGICLTAVAIAPENGTGWFEADPSPETLARTTAGKWADGTRVNLERPLRIGDELGGHLVSGHVDGPARLDSRTREGDCERFRFAAPEAQAPLIAEKGSVAVDGVSLTVARAEGRFFEISLIPHTLAVTTLFRLQPGDDANLEVDPLARNIARMQEFRNE